jgi:hypothetical protein
MRVTPAQTVVLIMVLSYLFAADSNPISDLPPIMVDETASVKGAPNTHTTIFNPIGKYATDVQYQLIRIPIHFQPIKKAQEELNVFMHNIKNLVKTRATEIPICQIVDLANVTLTMIKQQTQNMILNLPTSKFSPHGSEKKRFLNLIFGITATAFGIGNTLQISKLNAQMAKTNARQDMLVDISQLHENHLYTLDIKMNQTTTVLTDFVKYSPAVASQALTQMLMHVQNVQTRIEDGLDQAQLHRLSHKLFPNDVLETIKANIDVVAEKNGFLSFVNQVTDLFQIPLSYVYQPGNETVSLILHVPFVKHENLLQMHQYLPFPLSHDLSPNHSVTPAVGQNDILAYSGYETYKIVSQSDLAACHKMGDIFFCKGRNDLRTDIQDTCLGALFLQQPKGIQKQCKFEIQSSREQVFKLAHNKWSVATQKQYTTHQVCGKNRRPIIIGPGAVVTLNPGCKVRLETHILTADSFEEVEIEPTYFTWNWNASQIFPDLAPTQFSEAMQSLQDYGLHIVDASDIAHHLKFSNFNEPIPFEISQMFNNPMHYATIVLSAIIIIYFVYKLFQNYLHRQLKAKLPPSIAHYIPSAPAVPYIHNDPMSLPKVIFT